MRPYAPPMPPPPVAPRRPHPLTAHGDERVDDWYWLRSDDRDDPEVLALLEAENAHVAAALAHTDQLQADLFAEMKARIKETDLSVPFRKGERWFYSRTEEGQQYPFLCRTARDPGTDLVAGEPVPGEEVLLDLNALAGDSDYFALGAYDLAPGQDLLLYSTDHDGSERYTMRVARPPDGDGPRRRHPRHHLRHCVGRGQHLLLRPPRRDGAAVPGLAPRGGSAHRQRRARLPGGRRALLRLRGPEPHRGVDPHQQRLEGDDGGAPPPRRRPDAGADGRPAPRAGRGVRRHPRPDPEPRAIGS